MKERHEDQKKKVKVVRHDTWNPTQEELLEEAKITEEMNLKSLGISSISIYHQRSFFQFTYFDFVVLFSELVCL